MSNDQIPDGQQPADQISDEQRQREIEQTQAILRRFRNWAKQAPLRDLIALTEDPGESNTSPSNPKS